MHLIPKKYGAKLQSADSISYYYYVVIERCSIRAYKYCKMVNDVMFLAEARP